MFSSLIPMEFRSSSNAFICTRFPFFLLNSSSMYLPLIWNLTHLDFNYNVGSLAFFLLDSSFSSAEERTSFWSHTDRIPAPAPTWLPRSSSLKIIRSTSQRRCKDESREQTLSL